MAVRTRVRSSREGWLTMQDELVTALAGRGVLHCSGVAAALLDTGQAMSEHGRSVGSGQDETGRPGAP